jgi:hypothetical protein
LAGPEHALAEHVPKKLLDFFDQDMLKHIYWERILFDQAGLPDRKRAPGLSS